MIIKIFCVILNILYRVMYYITFEVASSLSSVRHTLPSSFGAPILEHVAASKANGVVDWTSYTNF